MIQILEADTELLDLDKFAGTPLTRDPFDFLIVPEFVSRPAAQAAAAAFPGPDLPGVLPVTTAPSDDAFGRLVRALRSEQVTAAFAEKFDMDLSCDSLMVTRRTRTRLTDGRIHTDSKNKRVTALIYLNTGWDDSGGRLRLLRGPNDIEDVIAEVAPVAGTLLAFRRSERSWHGHKPFDGVRRSIMLNWMNDAATVRRELMRHAISASVKRVFGR
jgi:SM-20-related protein